MKRNQYSTHIKCTVEEDAPLFESYIYINGATPETDNIVQLPPEVFNNQKFDVEQIVNDLIIDRGLKIKKVEQLTEPLYALDLDATRTDDLPYIILNIKDIDLSLQNKAG